jgi:predicted short-subunit dehydrogenase-like oxidoreductase (DUF2520 family)
MSLAVAMQGAGHRPVGVVARRTTAAEEAAQRLDAVAVADGAELPAADLLIVAVRDDAVGEVAATLAPRAGSIRAAVHLSGLAPVGTLAPLSGGAPVGAFHPLQTLPSIAAGAARLGGAWAAVTTADPGLRETLHGLARSLGMHPFDLADEAKPAYHAAAAAAANFPLADLVIARDLLDAAGVPFAAARPLVEAIVANAFELGPEAALTGPVARGDVGTVAGQLAAVDAVTPEWSADYRAAVARLARIAGRTDAFDGLVGASDR